MKRNSVFKGILVSVALSAVLTGCGSSTTSDNGSLEDMDKIKTTTITGKAIDGYLQYATVCLDLNGDGYCQSTEPINTTKEDGSFKLDISADIQQQDNYKEAMLLVYGGKDADSGLDFAGKLLSPKDSDIINITPITTLVAQAVKNELKTDPDMTKQQLEEKIKTSKEKVAKALDISIEDVSADPVAIKAERPQVIKEALKLHKSIEAIVASDDEVTDENRNEKIEEIYEKLAKKLSDMDDEKGAEKLIKKVYIGDNRSEIADAVSQNIEKSFKKFHGKGEEIKKIVYIAEDDIKKAKEKKRVEERDDDDKFFGKDIDWSKILKRPNKDESNRVENEDNRETGSEQKHEDYQREKAKRSDTDLINTIPELIK